MPRDALKVMQFPNGRNCRMTYSKVLSGPDWLYRIDASEAPAHNYPVPGGPGIAETVEAFRAFAGRNRIAAISVSGWAGSLNRDGRTRDACSRVLAFLTGT